MTLDPSVTRLPSDTPAIVKEASTSDAAIWDDFLATQSAASFYHLFAWREIVRSSLGHEPVYLMAWQGASVVGVLPLVLVSSRIFGRILCSMPFVNYGGPCAESDNVARQLVKQAISTSDALAADYLELRCAAPLTTDVAVSLRKVSMTIKLDSDPDVVWSTFTRKHAKNIRRAYKNNLDVTSGGIEFLSTFYNLLESSWRDLGTPLYKREYFKDILEAFPDNTRIFVCSRDNAAVGATFIGHYNGSMEGMWAAVLPDARNLQVNYVLYWEMIRFACLNGFRQFHLGRSTAHSGGEEFKSRWNADTKQLYWYYHRQDGGPIPELNVDNPRYRLAIEIWRRMPMWIVRRLGPRLARSIP